MFAKKGFTLIELLVVISVITLLMAILLPVLQHSRNQARAVICQTNLRQWGTLFHMYSQENEDYFFPSLEKSAIWFLRGNYVRTGDPNIPPVLNEMDTRDFACCPMAQKVGPGHWSMKSGGVTQIEGCMGSTFEAWDLSSPLPRFPFSYGFNGAVWKPYFFGFPTSRHRISFTRYGLEMTHIKDRSKIPIFFDCTLPIGEIRSENNRPPQHPESGVFINRHNGCVNVLFMDFSVQKVGLKGLYTLKWTMEFNTAGPWTKAGGVRPEDWPEWMHGFKDY